MSLIPVTLIPGDGIGPEVVSSTQKILTAVGAPLKFEVCLAGAEAFKNGIETGVPLETIESIKRTRLVLKGPLETPVGYGEKSANVTLRKLFETFANIRPVKEFAGVSTPYSGRGLDLVIVRENVEDLYAGIEHMQTAEVAQCLKLISRRGSEKAIRTAFELARSENRKKVHCATKANIMKMTEGLFKKVFEEVAKEYPEIEAQHIIVDNCAHQLVKKPEQFEVIVTTNMNGDILSDLTSALVGGLGFAPSANLGHDIAIFEAVHGSAPKYKGKDVINPSAVILSGALMLRHLGLSDLAIKIENAIRVTLESGYKTQDVAQSLSAIGTSEFTDRVIANLDKIPEHFSARRGRRVNMENVKQQLRGPSLNQYRTVGLDVFVRSDESAEVLGDRIKNLSSESGFYLKMISNRGTKVYPGEIEADCVDQFRCRFMSKNEVTIGERQIVDLLHKLNEANVEWMHIEKLNLINNQMGWTKAQGEEG